MHGDIDAPGQQGFVDFLGEQSLAADLRQGAVEHLSPVVLMTTMAVAPGRGEVGMGGREAPCTSWAWASASGLPRVPMRSGSVMAVVLGGGSADGKRVVREQ